MSLRPSLTTMSYTQISNANQLWLSLGSSVYGPSHPLGMSLNTCAGLTHCLLTEAFYT